MRPLRRLVLLATALLALVAAGSAVADHLDPQKRITPADQARARAMLLKQADLPAGFQGSPTGIGEPHVNCSQAVSEADLTQTGDAEGLQFIRGTTSVNSGAQIYESAADATASWRRGTSAAGIQCLTSLLRREFARQGIRLVSFRKIAFPRVAQRTVAYRVTLALETPQGTVRLFADVVVMSHSRALTQVFVASALTAPSRAEELRLARLVAGRMARVMR
jgi:hypothetical protein